MTFIFKIRGLWAHGLYDEATVTVVANDEKSAWAIARARAAMYLERVDDIQLKQE